MAQSLIVYSMVPDHKLDWFGHGWDIYTSNHDNLYESLKIAVWRGQILLSILNPSSLIIYPYTVQPQSYLYPTSTLLLQLSSTAVKPRSYTYLTLSLPPESSTLIQP